MAKHSAIEWTEATWNPWHGCHKVSAGCKNCYMFRDKAKYGQDPNVVVRSKTRFNDPLKWKEPKRIFTCSWSDFFIEESDPWRDEAFAIMALTPHHTYQVLTKRPDRMLEYMAYPRPQIYADIDRLAYQFKVNDHMNDWFSDAPLTWPLPNVHLGVSVEDQTTADERIPLLMQTPAAVRWLSMEPLLDWVDLSAIPIAYGVWLSSLCGDQYIDDGRLVIDGDGEPVKEPRIDWVVAGGESGLAARPTHPLWARSIRDQCTMYNVPFFFKQWGEYYPCVTADEASRWPHAKMHEFEDGQRMVLIGKKAAGRTLDGRTWDELPLTTDNRLLTTKENHATRT